MTERLYYEDSFLTHFLATVEAVEEDGRRVYLDRTAFYPSSGGQPHDPGVLDGEGVVGRGGHEQRVAPMPGEPVWGRG